MKRRHHNTPHDAFFKRVFSESENALGLLRLALPAELVDAIDPLTVRVEPASSASDELAELHRDLVISAKLRGLGEVLVFVIVEHQSRARRLMPYRFLHYVVQFWESWSRNHKRSLALPAVIPLVVYQGPGPWSGPRTLAELIDLPAKLRAPLLRYVPSLELAVHDLGTVAPDALAAAEVPAFARLALLFMQSALRDKNHANVIDRYASVARELAHDPDAAERMKVLVRYSSSIGHVDMEKLKKTVKRIVFDDGYAFTDEEVREQAGRRALVALLRAQLRAKFGRLDDATKQRVEDARTEELTRWGGRVIKAKTLAGVFAPRSKRTRR